MNPATAPDPGPAPAAARLGTPMDLDARDTASDHDEAQRAHATLAAELEWLRARLEAGPTPGQPATERATRSTRLNDLAAGLDLTSFERDTLLLAAAVELDGEVAALVADLAGTDDPRPTFGLALQVLDDGHWDALAPSGALRRWRLVTLVGPGTVATRRLQVDEDVLHHLAGLPLHDTGLEPVIGPIVDVALSPSQQRRIEELAGVVGASSDRVVVHLDGDDHAATSGVALRLAARLAGTATAGPGRVLELSTAALSPPGTALEELRLLVDRSVALSGSIPVLVLPRTARAAGGPDESTSWLLARLAAPIVLTVGPGSAPVLGRVAVRARIDHPPADERRRLWRDALEVTGTTTDDGVLAAADELAHHHRLGADDIHRVVDQWALASPGVTDAAITPADRLRRQARRASRVDLDGLAQRLATDATWDDLVLPAGHLEVLHDLARQVRHRARVHTDWGFAARSHGDLGITALFAGESGTGKTLAARVVGNELGLDLYRIDLSATVDKYIGETEKNLSRIFDAAEAGGVVLLFDEADALFGKRGEVRDGQDRYANLEVAHLLQRMEAYRGLAILTTNLRSNVDKAFLRRLRFVLNFPFPEAQQRAAIWRRVFPADAPVEGVDPDRLAAIGLTGGSIAAIALSAAFTAADDGTAITPAHLRKAARIDAAKHDRVLTDRELAVLS